MENTSSKFKRGVVFHFSDWNACVYSGRAIDFDAWRYSIKAFGLDTFRVIDTTRQGLDNLWFNRSVAEELDWKDHKSLDEFYEQNPNDEFIHLETAWTIPEDVEFDVLSKDYVHDKPEDLEKNIWYILGPPSGFNISKGDKRRWLSIPQETKGGMHSAHILPVLLWDIYNKEN
mgnify:FL=1